MNSFLGKVECVANRNLRNNRLSDTIDSFMYFAGTSTPRQIAIEIVRQTRKFHMTHDEVAEFYDSLRRVSAILRVTFNLPNVALVKKKLENDGEKPRK